MGSFSIPLPDADSLFYRMEEYLEPLVRVEMVRVGDPGNLADSGPSNTTRRSGAVNYEYNIGRYEITNQEYVTFLNAVDPLGANVLRLYDSGMTSDNANGGVVFSLQSVNGEKYQVKAGFANRPVSYIDFHDSMRFCNWLHNGAQIGGDTENGAYTLVGGTPIPTNSGTVMRNVGARFAIPTEDEWYKAAFYQPFSDGGDTDNYWEFATRSNQEPAATAPPGGVTSANYDRVLTGITDVGSYTNAIGYYGTFDMAGNLFEWVDSIRGSNGTVFRVRRGGAWNSSESSLEARNASNTSANSDFHINGFRITSP